MTRSRRPFLALALAQIFSLSGTRLSMIAIPWLVLTSSGDPMLTGIVAFAEMLPYVFAKALGGPLIDRIGSRTIAVIGDLGSTGAIALVPLLHALDALEMVTLVPVVIVMGTLRGPADAAKQSLVPAVARYANLPIERVTGTLGTIERLASTIGAAAAGALVAIIGAAPALALNAATFGISALIVIFGIGKDIQPKSQPEPPQITGTKSGYRQEFAEGWSFLRQDAVLVGIVFMVAITNFLDQAFAAVLVPVWAQKSGNGVGVVGLLFAVVSGFSVLGAVLATGFGERMPRLPVYAIAFLITGFPRFVIFMTDMPMFGIIAVLASAGFASGFLNPILSAVIFERIPPELVGRVNSLVMALCWALIPFGGLAAGAAVGGFGLSPAFLIAGMAYLAATMLPLALKSFRALSVRPHPAAESHAA